MKNEVLSDDEQFRQGKRITMTIVLKVRPEKREEFLQAMCSLNNRWEKQEDLIRSALYQQVNDQTGFSLIYEWETYEEHERYLDAEKFRVLLGALKVLCEESTITYGYIYEK